MSDFNWQPTLSSGFDIEPRVLSARFGDGYEQRTLDGINAKLRQWRVTFRDSEAVIAQIESFLASKGGVTSFTWTPSGSSETRVICRRWSRAYLGGAGEVSCVFEEAVS